MRKRACIVRQGDYSQDLLVRREANGLREAGFDVDVICTATSQHPNEEVIDGIRVYRLPPERMKRSIARYLFEYVTFFFLAALKLSILHLQHPYALIQVNTMPDFLVFATLVPRLLGAKVTLQMYEPMPELWATKFRLGPLIKLLEVIQQSSLRYAHAAFAVTQQLKDSFVARGAEPDKIAVVLNVPDTCFFETQATMTTPTSNNHFTLICHGAIEERYGHDTMLEAIHLLRSDIPKLRLRILGAGSYLDTFLTRIEALELQEYVQYLGYVPLPQLVKELQSADVGIVAQKSSPYSNLVHTGKMYDYLYFNKPVIASKLKAVSAYFDEESLCYFTPGDSEDLAKAIQYLYRHPEARERLTRNARRLYERYHWKQQRTVYMAISKTLTALDTTKVPLSS
jgi:glycosyltransferase involved in cell wall biosynthesis